MKHPDGTAHAYVGLPGSEQAHSLKNLVYLKYLGVNNICGA